MNSFRRMAAVQAAVQAAQRRRRIALWLEHFERLERTPARSPAEALAKSEALAAMEAARP